VIQRHGISSCAIPISSKITSSSAGSVSSLSFDQTTLLMRTIARPVAVGAVHQVQPVVQDVIGVPMNSRLCRRPGEVCHVNRKILLHPSHFSVPRFLRPSCYRTSRSADRGRAFSNSFASGFTPCRRPLATAASTQRCHIVRKSDGRASFTRLNR
jgi:hypothetical protein